MPAALNDAMAPAVNAIEAGASVVPLSAAATCDDVGDPVSPATLCTGAADAAAAEKPAI